MVTESRKSSFRHDAVYGLVHCDTRREVFGAFAAGKELRWSSFVCRVPGIGVSYRERATADDTALDDKAAVFQRVWTPVSEQSQTIADTAILLVRDILKHDTCDETYRKSKSLRSGEFGGS